MAYSNDLKKRVVSFIEAGGSKVDAVKLFKLSRYTIYRWLNSGDIQPKKTSERQRKIVKSDLIKHVEQFPDALLRERAEVFGVCPSAISLALRKLNMRKKNVTLRREKSQ